jgi:hypothetical protein
VTNGAPIYLGTPTTSVVGIVGILGNSAEETTLSAGIYAPGSTCTITGHVDLYGSMVCSKIVMAAGASITVHYDLNMATGDTQQTVTTASWNEKH